MKFSIALIFVALGVCFAGAAPAETPNQSEIQLLDQLEQEKTDYNRSLFTELGRFKKFDNMPMSAAVSKVKERVGWLIERTAKPDSDYRLGYALAVYQWKMGDSQDSALTLAKADLRSFVDSQRCDDKSSPPSRIGPWRNAAQPIYLAIRALSQEQKAKIREVIEREEPQMALRVQSSWMCSGGGKQITKVLQKYPEIGALDAAKPIPQAILDKYPTVIAVKEGRVELTDYSIQPDFMPEEVWKRDLPAMINAFKKSYFAALEIN